MQPTRSQLNYTLRRVVYDTLLAANAVVELRAKGHAFQTTESYKILRLLMARNLNEFFFESQSKTKHPHDIRVAAFDLPWDFRCEKRFAKARFDDTTSLRVSRIVAHIVMTRQPVFRSKETLERVEPLLMLAVEFVCKCRQHDRARYTGRCREYAIKLNRTLAHLKLPLVPFE